MWLRGDAPPLQNVVESSLVSRKESRGRQSEEASDAWQPVDQRCRWDGVLTALKFLPEAAATKVVGKGTPTKTWAVDLE